MAESGKKTIFPSKHCWDIFGKGQHLGVAQPGLVTAAGISYQLVDHIWIEGIGEKLVYSTSPLNTNKNILKNDEKTDYFLTFWDGKTSRANLGGCTPRALRASGSLAGHLTYNYIPNSSAKPTKNRIAPGKLTYPLKRDHLKEEKSSSRDMLVFRGMIYACWWWKMCIMCVETKNTVNTNVPCKNTPVCIGCIPVPLTNENESVEEGTNHYFTVGTGPHPNKVYINMYVYI